MLSAIAPKRVDLAVDTVAGPLFNEVLSMLGYAGRISVVGLLTGAPSPGHVAELPKRDLSKAIAPTGAMSKTESNVHIVVAIRYSPRVLMARLAISSSSIAARGLAVCPLSGHCSG